MYIAQKPITLGTKTYFIGEEIPEEMVDPNRAKALTNYGYIKHAPETLHTAPPMASGTEAHRDAKEGVEAVKKPLNSASRAAEAKRTAKKGGK